MVILGGASRKIFLLTAGFAMLLSGCSEVSYSQKASPANTYKDHRPEDQNRASVIGVGSPVSKQEMRAKSTFSVKGRRDLSSVMARMAGVYNVAIRWGDGVRADKLQNILIADLNFEESRAYIEDVFGVQIIREGKRRLLILPSTNEKMVTKFAPGINVTLAQAVRGLADQCEYNIIINEKQPKLAQTLVTTSLTNVTCFDAFEGLLSPHGMSLEDHGNYYLVGGFPQRQWRLNLLEPLREEEAEVTYSSTLESESNESGGGTGTVGGKSAVRIGVQRDLWEELREDLDIVVQKSCEEAQKKLNDVQSTQNTNNQGVLSPPGTSGNQNNNFQQSASGNQQIRKKAVCGYVRINKAVGLVQMRAAKSILEEADEIIRRVEDIASRRLLLEARVLAVTRTRDFQQGSDLKFGAGDDGAAATSDVGITGGFQSRNVATSITSAIGSFLSSVGVDQNGGYLGTNIGDISTVVRMIEEYGTTYNLMQPMMELMDRQRATLVDGESRIYTKSEVSRETDPSGAISDSLTREVRSQFVGLQFSASAQIADEGEPHTVMIQIPITSFIENFTVGVEFRGQQVIDTIPVTSTRIIDQKVRIRDGEIKVIGGLTKTLAIDRESGQPLLREMPAFGKLFNDENIAFEEVEFVVLLQVRRLY